MDMDKFGLRGLCNELIGDLTESVGDKNIIKLSVDVQLPKKFIGTPGRLMESIKDIALYISGNLINGAISIEIIKRNEHENRVNAQVQITGIGSFKGKDPMSKEEVKNRFKDFPYTVHHKTSEGQINFEFDVSFHTAGVSEKKDKLPFEKKRILVAEDNEINAIVFSNFLEEWGCEVTIAVNGAEAVSRAHDATYEVILMDIHMPILNGNKAIVKIREFNATIPIIALTASTVEDDIGDAMNAGANDYLLKPISSAHLFQVLSKYLLRTTKL